MFEETRCAQIQANSADVWKDRAKQSDLCDLTVLLIVVAKLRIIPIRRRGRDEVAIKLFGCPASTDVGVWLGEQEALIYTNPVGDAKICQRLLNGRGYTEEVENMGWAGRISKWLIPILLVNADMYYFLAAKKPDELCDVVQHTINDGSLRVDLGGRRQVELKKLHRLFDSLPTPYGVRGGSISTERRLSERREIAEGSGGDRRTIIEGLGNVDLDFHGKASFPDTGRHKFTAYTAIARQRRRDLIAGDQPGLRVRSNVSQSACSIHARIICWACWR